MYCVEKLISLEKMCFTLLGQKLFQITPVRYILKTTLFYVLPLRDFRTAGSVGRVWLARSVNWYWGWCHVWIF